MCSGLAAYSALNKLAPIAAGESIAIVGLGGLGMMGLQFARVLYPEAAVIGVDVDDGKLEAALKSGASAVYNSGQEDAAKQVIKATKGGVSGAVDFVGAETSLGFANQATARGGKVAIVGLFGGRLSMPIPMFPLRAISLIGSYAGSLAEAMAMLDLVKAGKVDPIPIEQRPLDQAGPTLDDLRQGKVLGRVVLTCA